MYREESNGRQSVGQLAAAAKARFQQQQRHQRRQYTKKLRSDVWHSTYLYTVVIFQMKFSYILSH